MATESQVDTLVANSNGDRWLAGRFRGAMTLPEPAGAANARNIGGYVVRLNPEWRATWALVIDGEGDDTAFVAGEAEGSLWVTGSFAKTVNLPLAGVSALTSTGATSAYSIRLLPDPPVATTLGGLDAEVTVRGAAPTGTGGLLVAGHSSGDLYPGRIPPSQKTGAFLASYSIDGDLRWLRHSENGDTFSYDAVGAPVEHGAVVAGVGAISDSAAGGPGQVSLARYSAAGLAGWSRREAPVGQAFDLDTRPGEVAMAGYYIRESRLTLQSSSLSCGRSPLTPENARSEKAFMVWYRRDSVR